MVEIWENEKYIRKRGFTEKRGKTLVPRYREEMRRILREKRVKNNIFLCKCALLGPTCIEKVVHPFKLVCLFFLIFLLRRSPSLVVCFPLLKIHYFGPQLDWSSHYSKWAWAASFSGPYTNINFFFFFFVGEHII